VSAPLATVDGARPRRSRAGRNLLRVLHVIFALLAFFTVLAFWIASFGADVFMDEQSVLQVKRAVVRGLFVLVPAMILSGATGRALAGPKPKGLAARKLSRMRLIALNGIFVLVPSALVLRELAERGELGQVFFAVQVLELVAGGLNLLLLARNAREGMALSGRLPRGSLRVRP